MGAEKTRLTTLAHGGGCGCKLAPSVLQELLRDKKTPVHFQQLLVGTETGDDAAVWRLNEETCIIATTDFFMPMVDDPFDFGRIAAANALSDIYAMGGRPLMALAILGMPLGALSVEAVREILRGGDSLCAEAGIPVAGGHSIDCPEPVFGLAVTGSCRPEHIRRNSEARAGDALILTKPIGIGVYSAAFKKSALNEERYAEMMTVVTRLNAVGADLAKDAQVHAMTDVTGFGLLGHAMEMAKGSGHRLVIHDDSVPLLSGAEELVKEGHVTGASGRNWASYGESVILPENFPAWRRTLLTDPQTSGGLLIACASNRAAAILDIIAASGCAGAAIIGFVEKGESAAVEVEWTATS
jgi:selenide,water dikinase